MVGIKPPLHYTYNGNENIIQGIALREYYSAIDVFSEIMSYHEKTKNYPKNLVIQYMAHVIHLATQMAAFEKNFIQDVIDMKNQQTQMQMFSASYALFKKIQCVMKKKGFLKVSGSFRMTNQNKGEAMALGFG